VVNLQVDLLPDRLLDPTILVGVKTNLRSNYPCEIAI